MVGALPTFFLSLPSTAYTSQIQVMVRAHMVQTEHTIKFAPNPLSHLEKNTRSIYN